VTFPQPVGGGSHWLNRRLLATVRAGGRNAVEGELLVRVTPQKILAYNNISG
jgi:hypothetical protein